MMVSDLVTTDVYPNFIFEGMQDGSFVDVTHSKCKPREDFEMNGGVLSGWMHGTDGNRFFQPAIDTQGRIGRTRICWWRWNYRSWDYKIQVCLKKTQSQWKL